MPEWLKIWVMVVLLAGAAAISGTYLAVTFGLPNSERPYHPEKIAANHSTDAQASQPGTENHPFFVQIVPAPKSDDEAAQDAADREEKIQTDVWLVRFTGLLFLVGVIQAIVFIVQANRLKETIAAMKAIDERQSAKVAESIAQATRAAEAMKELAEETKKQALLSHQSYLASHRPLLKIHSLRVLPPIEGVPQEEQSLRAQFAVVNAGTGRCDIIGSAVYLQYLFEANRPYLPELARNDVIALRAYNVGTTDNSVIVETNRRGWLDYNTASFIAHGRRGPELHDDTSPTGRTLYLSGWIVYKEANGNSRTTYFRRIYRHASERFVPSQDPDDEATY
jgi:hypothetical protein